MIRISSQQILPGQKADRAKWCGAAPLARSAVPRSKPVASASRSCRESAAAAKNRGLRKSEGRGSRATVRRYAPDESGLFAEVPAPETITKAGEPAGERESE